MARWAVVVEENMANGIWSPRVLAEIEGTREDAVAELKRIVPDFTPTHPMTAKQRTLYRDGDRYLLVSRGAMHTYHCVFRVWEMLWDSKRPEVQAGRLGEDA
ncbi:hypothetical protein GCM10010193_51650 [Kitasatospora atroaurantiaca]|uniref:Uncharacterized protein n=1 Tax=Kitasatospora atroaurantiaca TaxID=285545 RepID=A0A561EXW7_9ACTN|nr:hypothetical protein [Kitasatospora atroaurantiaca]TWE20460.1 hypothetical protein FB465_5614 [Kitasatospora atroaurantiaca]